MYLTWIYSVAKHFLLIVGVVYRSPYSNESNDSNLWDLFKVYDNVDFNLPNINWNSWTVPNWDSPARSFG